MLLSTTPTIEGLEISEYCGVVFGEVINGVSFTKDFLANITNFVGGRSKSYEGEIIAARDNALSEMIERALSLGANAIVGVKVDYECITMGSDTASMLMVTASGTAVVLSDPAQI